MRLVDVAGVILGFYLLVSVVPKVLDRRAFASKLSAYGLTLPAGRISWALVWIGAELIAAVALFTSSPLRFLFAVALVAVATGAVARRVFQGATHDCGCGASEGRIGVRLLVRNVVLIGVGGVGHLALNTTPLWTLTAAILVAATAGFLAVGRDRPVVAGDQVSRTSQSIGRELKDPVLETVEAF